MHALNMRLKSFLTRRQLRISSTTLDIRAASPAGAVVDVKMNTRLGSGKRLLLLRIFHRPKASISTISARSS